MDLSVIVPCYNTERYIRNLLKTLKAQKTTYSVEYIFVMNMCTDDTERVIRESGLDCKILQCDVRGCGCARNVGIEESTGRYIWFMDSDDWLTSHSALQTAMEFADGKPMVRLGFKSNKFKREYFSMVWQYIFSRQLIGDTRFRKIQPCEDDVFTEEMLNKLGLDKDRYKEIPTIRTPLYYYYYLREGSNITRYARGEDINI